MYLEMSVAELFKSFKSSRRISQFLAEGFANDNAFLVGAATEELITREEEAAIAVVLRGAVEGGHFHVDSPVAANFGYVLSTAGGYHPILSAIDREIYRSPKDRLWVERTVASAVEPSRSFETDQELAKWFLEWLKDDECFQENSQIPNSDNTDNGPIIPEIVDDK